MASKFFGSFLGFESFRIAVIKTVMRYRFEPRSLITVFITSERFFPFKKGLKILRHQRLFLNLRTFLDSGLERGVCLPAKNPEREKESEREGDGL